MQTIKCLNNHTDAYQTLVIMGVALRPHLHNAEHRLLYELRLYFSLVLSLTHPETEQDILFSSSSPDEAVNSWGL